MRLRLSPQLRGLSEAAIADGFRRGLIAFQDGIATPVVIGAATASDNFDRANGPLGSNWAVWSSGSLPVISGQAVLPASSSQDYRATWKASVNTIGPRPVFRVLPDRERYQSQRGGRPRRVPSLRRVPHRQRDNVPDRR